MSFTYPEIKSEGAGEDTVRSSNGWDSKCSSFELLENDIKYGKRKKPQQSPININTKTVQECSTLCNLEINYKPGKCTIDKYEDNLIRLLHDEGSYIKFGENNYELKFIFFHTPGNHLIDGKNAPMEINFYHGIMEEMDIKRVQEARNIKIKNKHNHKHFHAHTDGLEDNNLNGRKNGVVLSVMVDVEQNDNNETRASKPNIFMSQFIHTDSFRDLKPNEDPIEINVGKKWSVELLIPEKKAFYTYNGSIAMPPCTENYTWVVFDQHISIISEYLKLFRVIGNPKGNREAHPLNNRMVFFNPNVKTQDKDIKTEDKNSFVEQQLSPIRISYDNRAGSEYRARADYVINKYMNGDNVGWYNDESKLKSITNDWEEASKIGYKDIQVSDLKNFHDPPTNPDDDTQIGTFETANNLDLDDLVLDFYIYNGMDYWDYFLDVTNKQNPVMADGGEGFTQSQISAINLLNLNGDIFKTGFENRLPLDDNVDPQEPTFTDDIGSIENNFSDTAVRTNIKNYLRETYPNQYEHNRNAVDSETTDEVDGETTDEPDDLVGYITDDDVERVLTYFADFNPNDKILAYVLFCWKKDGNNNVTSAMDIFEQDISDTLPVLKKKILYNILSKFKNEPIIFKVKNNELNSTIDGDTCQHWGSNKVHYEGNFLKFWEKPLSVPEDGVAFNDMTPELKEAAKDGLLKWNSTSNKFERHNECRNPSNFEGAPWCYTTNSKNRWQYCAIPDSSTKSRYYILIFVFIMLVLLAIFLVKLIFKYEYFSEFVSKITGGNLTSETVSGGVSKPEVPASVGTTAAAAATSAARML